MKSEPEAVASGLQHYLLACEYRSGYKTRPVWNDTDTPLAYLITFRSYGTWLHGDERSSIDRFHNRYKSPYIDPNATWQRHNAQVLQGRAGRLGRHDRWIWYGIRQEQRDCQRLSAAPIERNSFGLHRAGVAERPSVHEDWGFPVPSDSTARVRASGESRRNVS